MNRFTNSNNGPVWIWIYRLGKILLGGLFVWSGTIKLMDTEVFEIVIDAFGILPSTMVTPVAWVLPILEVLFGLALLMDIAGALTSITGLMFLFLAILGYGIYLGLDIDCGCLGPSDPEYKAFNGLRSAFYRDLLLLAVIALLYYLRRRLGIKPRQIDTNLFKGA